MITLKLKTLFLILPALCFLSPIWAAEFTYKELYESFGELEAGLRIWNISVYVHRGTAR